MKRIVRWILVFFGSLLLVLGLATAVAWYYKPELTVAIHEKLQENINGEFNIDNISVSFLNDFPLVSVTLEGTYVRGVHYSLYKKDFLKAGKILVNVHMGKLFLKQIDVKSIKIKDAEVFIFRTKSGYTNLDIFKTNSAVSQTDTLQQKSPALLDIHTIYFNNVSITYYDSLKEKVVGFRFVNGKNEVIRTDSSRQFRYEGKIDFDRIQFNEAKGSYLLSQKVEAELNGEFIFGSKTLNIFPSYLQFAASKVNLSGAFHFVPQGEFKLDIHSGNLRYAEGRAIIPKSLSDKLANYDISLPFVFNVHLIGMLSGGDEPRIDLDFETKDALVTVSKYEASHMNVKGIFVNHSDEKKAFNDQNSKIEISECDGVFYGFPMKGKAVFANLSDPLLDLNLTVGADAKTLQEELDTAVFKLKSGAMSANFIYSGKLNDLADPAKRMNRGKFSGTAALKNMQLFWVPRRLALNNLNASVAFTRQQFDIHDFSFSLNQSPVKLSGRLNGFMDLFTHPDKRAFVSLKVVSSDLNTTSIFPENAKPKVVTDSKANNKLISDMIDKLYHRLEFDLSVNISKYQHKNFKATDISGNLALKNNQLQANPLRMKVAGGEVDVTFGLSQLNQPLNPLWIQASVHGADIREFFFAFNNFKQHTIDSRNLSGKISFNAGLTTKLDDDFNVMMPTLSGNVDLTVRDGKLTNFAPLEKLSNFLFKRRDFSDIQFAEIKSTFDLKGTELSISRMEIESTVISMFIEGRFSLADSTDLSIQLPLSNLKRRDKDYTPKNVGTDSKVGPSVFLRARPDDKGNMSIAYDMFKKFRKKR